MKEEKDGCCGGGSAKDIKELFDQWAENGAAESAREEHEYAVREVLANWCWKKTDRYLDIGCGNGYTLRIVAPKIPKGRAVGLDLSEKMIAKARLETKLSIPFEFQISSFDRWKVPLESFDKIFSMETFYYFEDVPNAIHKVYSLLKPGGRFACVVDYYEENKASEDWPRPEKCGVPMQRFSMKDWQEMFAAAGFENIVQRQIRYPRKLAKEPWQSEVGSLATEGERH